MRDSMVASRATTTAMPCFFASAAVCRPMQHPRTMDRSAPGRLCTKPRTVDALVKVTSTGCFSSSRTAAGLGASYTVS